MPTQVTIFLSGTDVKIPREHHILVRLIKKLLKSLSLIIKHET